jgi:hypothetical protein
MKILRSVNRRGFSVGAAGWFAILKPNTWFPASRLPGPFRYRGSQTAETRAVDHADNHETTVPPRIIMPNIQDRRLMRLALVVMGAITITSALLWWIMSGAPSNRY